MQNVFKEKFIYSNNHIYKSFAYRNEIDFYWNVVILYKTSPSGQKLGLYNTVRFSLATLMLLAMSHITLNIYQEIFKTEMDT